MLLDLSPAEKTVEGEGQEDEDVAVVDKHGKLWKGRLVKTPPGNEIVARGRVSRAPFNFRGQLAVRITTAFGSPNGLSGAVGGIRFRFRFPRGCDALHRRPEQGLQALQFAQRRRAASSRGRPGQASCK